MSRLEAPGVRRLTTVEILAALTSVTHSRVLPLTLVFLGHALMARAQGDRAKVPDQIAQVIDGGADLAMLDARMVQPYYSRLLAQSAGLTLTMAMDGEDVVVKAA